MSFPHAPTFPTFIPASDDHGTRFRPSAGLPDEGPSDDAINAHWATVEADRYADDLDDVRPSIERAARLDAGDVEDVPCDGCGSRADVLPVVGSHVTTCAACVRASAERDPEAVFRFLTEESDRPLPCPHCGWVGNRTAGQLVDHLRTAHKLSDDHAASVLVHAVEQTLDGSAAA